MIIHLKLGLKSLHCFGGVLAVFWWSFGGVVCLYYYNTLKIGLKKFMAFLWCFCGVVVVL